MLKAVKRTLAYMTPPERARYYLFLALRAIVGLFDLIGILAIGFLATSIALFITLGSDSGRVIEFAGVAIPAVTAQTLPIVAGLILGLFLAKALFSILLTRALAHFLALIEARAARQVAKAAFGTGMSQARKYSREDIYFAVQAGSPAAFNSLLNYTGTLVAEGALFLLVIIAFIIINPLAALATIIYFGLVAWVMQALIGGNRMKRASEQVNEGTISANASIGDLSEAIKEATVLGKKDFFLDRIYESRVKAASNHATQFVLNGMPRYIVETALILAISLFVLYQAIQGDLVSAAGTLGVFLSGGLRLTASLLPLQSALLSMKGSVPPAEKALDLLLNTAERDKPANASVFSRSSQPQPANVEITNLSFTYPNSFEQTITNLDLVIEPGQQVTLIGESGAGKSTIADLILGLLTPDSGKILINGKAPSELAAAQPGYLSYVPQKPGLISGTIEENIAFGIPLDEVDKNRLAQAIDMAHLTKVINFLQEGVQTDIGKRKDELSGGQLQRIGLARALYSQPGLLILDEATNALDVESELEIKKALHEMRGKVTVLLITHGFDTVKDSDFIVSLKDGTLASKSKRLAIQVQSPTSEDR